MVLIAGIGTDIVEIERIRKAVGRNGQRFLNRIFTKEEIGYCFARSDPFPSLAARFAAKEAVFKSLGKGLAGCRWTDIEIVRKAENAPQILLNNKAKALAEEMGITKILISISHDRGRAVAFAVAVKS